MKVICHVERRSAAFQEYDIQTEGRAMEPSYFPIHPLLSQTKRPKPVNQFRPLAFQANPCDHLNHSHRTYNLTRHCFL